MKHFRDRLQSLRYAFHRYMTPFIEFLDELQEARGAIRLTYPPTHRTFIDEVGMRGAQNRQWYFVCIINLGSKHRLEIGGEAILNETFVEPLGIRRNECEVLSDADLIVTINFFLDSVWDAISTLWPTKYGSSTSDGGGPRVPISGSGGCRV